VAETTTPLDRLVELFVYAPVGLALTLKDDLDAVVDRGRRTVSPQVQVAKFMGRLAVTQATRAAGDLVDEAIGRVVSTHPSDAPATTAAAPEPAATRPSENGSAGAPTEQASSSAPNEAQLAIPGYDSLSAAQVVQRLGALADTELDSVRRYEEAHRGRRTILGKIDQLQADRS